LGGSGAASEDLCDRHAAVEQEDGIVADSKEIEELRALQIFGIRGIVDRDIGGRDGSSPS
jgi:hypothetical protein